MAIGGQPEVLARVTGHTLQKDRVFRDVPVLQHVRECFGLSGGFAAVWDGPGSARHDDERRDAVQVEFRGSLGHSEIVSAEHEQAVGWLNRDA
jgi:hypothetical protein